MGLQREKAADFSAQVDSRDSAGRTTLQSPWGFKLCRCCVCVCVGVALPTGHGRTVITVLYRTSVVTARFSGVTVKTTINNPTIMCHWWDACSQMYECTYFFSHHISCMASYRPHPSVSLPLPVSLPPSPHTTRYFPSHDHRALSPHYQLIDRPHCFSSSSSFASSVAAVSVYDSARQYHPFSFRHRNDVQVLLSP